MHAFRKKLARERGYQSKTKSSNFKIINCTCGIKLKVDLSKGNIFRCPNCKTEWNATTNSKRIKKAKGTSAKKPTKKQTKVRFQREVDIETIKTYLTEQKKRGNPVSFYYRDDTSPRHFTNYFIDDRYVQVKSSKGYYIKFLIDKIRKL